MSKRKMCSYRLPEDTIQDIVRFSSELDYTQSDFIVSAVNLFVSVSSSWKYHNVCEFRCAPWQLVEIERLFGKSDR